MVEREDNQEEVVVEVVSTVVSTVLIPGSLGTSVCPWIVASLFILGLLLCMFDSLILRLHSMGEVLISTSLWPNYGLVMASFSLK